MVVTTSGAAETPARANTPKRSRRGQQVISTARVEPAEFKRNVWRAYPEEGTSYETVLSDSYWAHRAREFRAGDLIEVLPDEMHYFAVLLVRASGANWVRVVEVLKTELKPAAVPRRQSEFSVAWRGPHRKFAIVRASDGTIVKDGFALEDEAEAAMPQMRPSAS
jgi:hypothetical protein